MAPRTRAKATRTTRLSRQSTQFGELDTTPTSQHIPSEEGEAGTESPIVLSDGNEALGIPSLDLDDLELMEIEHPEGAQPTESKAFLWSEAGSLTRRSSPVRPGETPKSLWHFSDNNSLSATPPAETANDLLFPETIPLSTETQNLGEPSSKKERRVDFSETASTVRRSSPFALGDAMDVWDFQKSPSSLSLAAFSTIAVDDGNLPDTMPVLSTVEPFYDPPTVPGDVVVDVDIMNDDLIGPETDPGPSELRTPGQNILSKTKDTSSTDNGKANRPKQRAKPPIEFDESTGEIKKPVLGNRRPAQRACRKKPVQEDTASSSSPSMMPPKRSKAKQTSARASKKAKKATQKKATLKRSPARKRQTRATRAVESPKDDPDDGRCVAPSQPPMDIESDLTQQSPLAQDAINDASNGGHPDECNDIVVISSDPEDDHDYQAFSTPPSAILETCPAKIAPNLIIPEPEIEQLHAPPAMAQVKSKEALGLSQDLSQNSASRVVRATRENLSLKPPNQRPEHDPPLRSQPPKPVLQDIDSNIWRRRPVPPAVEKALRLPGIGSCPPQRAENTEHPQAQILGRRSARQFSVSEQGSPLPAGQAGFAQMASHGDDRQGAVGGPDRLERKLFTRNPESVSFLEASTPLIPTAQKAKIAQTGVGAAREKLRNGISQKEGWPAKVPSSDDASEHERRLAALRGLQEQAFASFAAQQAGSRSGDGRQQGNDQRTEGSGKAIEPGSRQARDDLSEQLHQVVDLLSSRMTNKRLSVHKISEAYRANGMRSVERIQNRCLREERSLRESYNQDEARFEQAVQTARDELERSRGIGEKSAGALEDDLGRRRVVYESVSSSLRALHGHILSGQAVPFGEASSL